MNYLRLIHWKADEAQLRAAQLRAAGYEVAYDPSDSGLDLQNLREPLPAGIVIDLSRLPSQGRDLAVLLRRRKATRLVPLVFVGGDARMVEQIRGLLPDAHYTDWERVSDELEQAIAQPPSDPPVPPL